MNRLPILFAVIWGAVIIGFVVGVFTVETSISLGSLAAVEHGFVALYVLLFLLLAFCIWIIPVSVVWLICRKRRKPEKSQQWER